MSDARIGDQPQPEGERIAEQLSSEGRAELFSSGPRTSMELKSKEGGGFKFLINGDDVFAGQTSKLTLELDAETMLPILTVRVPIALVDIELPECVVVVEKEVPDLLGAQADENATDPLKAGAELGDES